MPKYNIIINLQPKASFFGLNPPVLKGKKSYEVTKVWSIIAPDHLTLTEVP
jgi:hypothetical protein